MRVGGVTLGRYRCTVSTFADDTLLLAEDAASTQLLLDRFSDICGHDFMALNTSKTVAMIVNAQPNAVPVPLMLNGAELEYVDSLVYLGLTVRNTLSWTTHVTTQAAKAQVVIRERVSRVAHTDLPLHLQKADCKSRCWTVLEYGLDSAAATMEPESKCAFEQMYMRSCRALVHAGASGRGLQNAWILQELGMPRPEARLDWVALRFYFNICMQCLPCAGVTYMPTGHHGACIPEGVRAMHFIMGTQRGIIWVETLRTFMLRRTATDTTWSGVDPVRSRQVLESIAWAPLAPPQCRRSARHTRTMLQSAWVADLFTAEEVDLIRATPAPPASLQNQQKPMLSTCRSLNVHSPKFQPAKLHQQNCHKNKRDAKCSDED